MTTASAFPDVEHRDDTRPTFLQSRLSEAARIILLIFLVMAALIYLLHAIMAASFRYPLDYGEAPLVDQARRLAAGQNIYRPDLSEPPYTVANYPPLYVLSLTLFLKQTIYPFTPGRLISITAALLTALCLGMITYHHTDQRSAAMTSGLLFLAIPYVVHWSGLARVDAMALAWSSLGLLVLARWPESRWGWPVSGLFLVAAIYTRQSYALAAPLAAFAWLWTHRPGRAIRLAVLVGGLCLLILAGLTALTGGGFFFHVVTANVNAFSLARLGAELDRLAGDMPLLLLLALAFLIWGRKRIPLWPLLAGYLVGAAISTLTIGKIGSSVNYFTNLMVQHRE